MTATAATGRVTGTAHPNWIDRDQYPFDPNWVDLPEGRVHYVDEGPDSEATATSPDEGGESRDDPSIVLLHGNPTWSFLYRHLIRGLADEYRCLAPDLLGFGLSDAPATFSYLPADQARVVERFLGTLALDTVILVVHDWGGPIGLDYATRYPDTVSGIVAMNTWCWPRERLFDRLSSSVTDTAVLRRLVVRHDAFTRAAIAPLVVSAAVRGRWQQARSLRNHYTRPHATPRARLATWVLSREVGRSHEWLRGIWQRRHALGDTPIRLLWGARDPVHGSFLGRWQSAFSRVEATVYDSVGHFVPETMGRELVTPVRQFAGKR